MAEFNIYNNTFENDANVIKQYIEYNIGWDQLEDELRALRKDQNTTASLRRSSEELERAVKEKSIAKTRQTILKHASDFLTGAFANAAGAGLVALVKLFLP